jgi:polysaccharide deacetylase 2 family uncharacterized protein YibQ
VTGFFGGWRGLGRFWAIVASGSAVGAVVLQTLGPPPVPRPARIAGPVSPEPERVVVKQDPVAPLVAGPGRTTPGPLADPDPALLEADEHDPTRSIPRIAIDGRGSMNVYASGFDASSVRPRVGILIAGIGGSEADSMAAIRDLPRSVTLAITPYAGGLDRMLSAARTAGHEYLLSVPMEPRGFPINDPDDHHALMSSLSPEDNLVRLHWSMAQIAGYAGITTALGQMHGERLSGDPLQLDPVLAEAARRGLLFVDARPGQPGLAQAWNRAVDVLIDEDPVTEASLDAKLRMLSALARDKRSALGLVSVPRPKTLERVAAWSNGLLAEGLSLAPVSALVRPPIDKEVK